MNQQYLFKFNDVYINDVYKSFITIFNQISFKNFLAIVVNEISLKLKQC